MTMALRRPREGMKVEGGTHCKGQGGFQTRPYVTTWRTVYFVVMTFGEDLSYFKETDQVTEED